MPTYFHPVELAERCFLDELLFWVGFQRLPVIEFLSTDELELRHSDDYFASSETFWMLWEDECERAGIPHDPRIAFSNAGYAHVPVRLYDDLLAKNHLSAELRQQRSIERDAILAFEKAYAAWFPHFERVIEYPTSRIFVALKEGRLLAQGRLLPALQKGEVLRLLKASDANIVDIPITSIAPSFWAYKGINFLSSTAVNSLCHYCHISFSTDDVLKVFPGEPEDASGVQRIGRALILAEKSSRLKFADRRRGRPPYPWERFYVQVTTALQRNEMPVKKEAAIEYFQEWFQRECGIRPSRSAIGEKLKPYFDKFMR